jgi:cytochrome c
VHPDTRTAALAHGTAGAQRLDQVHPGRHPQEIIPGRTLFNNVCSHCHGTDGASPVSERDLRKLQRRYKDNWKDTA